MSGASWPITLVLLLAVGPSDPAAADGFTTRDFGFPWSDRPAPATEFHAHTADDRLHFAFLVQDDEVIVSETYAGESTLDGEDRVELFFANDAELSRYWCIEIDPLGRVHDYRARHYRRFDHDWSCPDLRVSAQRTPMGYRVQGSIGLKTLGDLLGRDARRGTMLRVGLFRAEFSGGSRGEADDDWISWVRPATVKPDFHVPSAFRLWAVP